MIKLFIADVSELDIDSRITEVSEYRREKIEKLPSIEAKQQSLGAELLLNAAVPNHPQYLIAEGGKPYFEGNFPFFSLSHSGKYALCAIADAEVGADIEAPRENSLRLAKRFFTDAEFEAVNSASDPDDEFCRIWVIKESYIKATGEGLSCPLNSFEAADTIGEHRTWHGELDGYHIAVCTKGDLGEIEIKSYTFES